MSHFLLILGAEDQMGWIKAHTAQSEAAKTLERLGDFTSGKSEADRFRALSSVIASFESLLAAWHRLAVAGKPQVLEPCVEAWNKMLCEEISTHSIAAFRNIVLGMDGAAKFRTSVSELMLMDVSAIETWKRQIDLLQ